MTVLSDLCMEPIAITDGVPLGIAGYPGYRFVVQLAIVNSGSLLGETFILGASVLGGPRWRDITGDIQGLTYGRGGMPAHRPIAGELALRLHNVADTWAPWTSPFYGPGSMLRVAIGNGTITKQQFCGQVQAWREASVGLDAYDWIDVTVWESMFLLAEVNDHALAGVVGGGETLTQRIDRLLAKADWQFDRDIASSTAATFQSTDLASDMATELYRTVDSVDATVWPAKDGKLKIRDRATGTGVHWTLAHQDQNPDSLITNNDDERILSSVDLARIGGASVTYTNTGLAGRYQRRSTSRTDLNTVAEAGNADLERVGTGMLARARQTYRPVSFEVTSGQGPGPAALIFDSDLTDRVTLDHGPVTFTNYAICGYQHAIQIAAAGVYWTTTINLDIEADSGWYLGLPTPALVGYARVGRTRVGTAAAFLPTPALVGSARVAQTYVGTT